MAVKRDGLYKRGSVWWIRTDPVDGKPRTTGFKDIEAARRYRIKRERLAADPAHAAAETARLDDWIRRVIASKERDGSSTATVEVYRTKLGHWLRIAPDALLAQVDPPFVDAYVAQRRTEEVTDHTISKEVTHLCTVLKAAKRAGCYPGDVATLRPPDLHAGYKPRKRALTREEVAALLAELKPELAALVAICVALGCRLSEAYRLQPTDIGAASVHIRGTKTDGSDRYVPILSIFAGLLARGARQLPLGPEPNNLRRDLAAACARAGIPSAGPNDFRRTHATLLAEAGVDRDVTRRLLGHTTTRLVDTVYGQPTTEALGALAEAKLLTAAPLTESPRHVAPEGEQNGKRKHDDREAEAVGYRDQRRHDNGSLSVGCAAGSAEQERKEGTRAGAGGHQATRGPDVGARSGHERVTLQRRDSEPQALTNPGADFEIRTRDLRFTKPFAIPALSPDGQEIGGYSRANETETGPSRTNDATRTLHSVPALALALAYSRVASRRSSRVTSISRRSARGQGVA
jgi:integrase